jgi:hypothetical protein
MDTATAEMVLYGMTAIAVAVWVGGLQFLVATVRREKKGVEESSKFGEPAPANLIYGSAEVEGNAAELSHRAATLLAAKSARIFQCTDESIDFETTNDYFPRQKFNIPVMHGQLRFTPLSVQTTRVDYAIAKPRIPILLIWAFAVQALGFVAIITGFLVLYFLAVPNQNPGVRWQTVQMVQVIHFLWPPFLLGFLHRKIIAVIKTQFDAFIHNLPFLAG